MNKTDWFRLCFGLLFTVLIACQPVSQDEENPLVEENEPAVTQIPAIAQQATATSGTERLPTNPPPPAPTPLPTADVTETWPLVGNQSSGLQMAIPPGWVNLSGELNTATATSELGLIALLMADSVRTGAAVLSEKRLGSGAFAAGMITNLMLPAAAPAAALQEMIEQLPQPATAVTSPVPVMVRVAAGGRISGAYADITGDAVIFPNGSDRTRTRLLLLPLQTAVSDTLPQTQILFLFSADVDAWDDYTAVFQQMAGTILIHNVWSDLTINDGSTNVQGALRETDLVKARLQAGASDAWTFTAQSGRYATITASPDDKDIDITLSLISPSGQTISQIDNGFGGDTESAIDLLLTEPGTYVIEVSEFFGASGRYTLSLALTEDPLFSGGGRIDVGQTIQSELPANGQKVWRFNGSANEQISVVLAPDDQFDAILDLYGPNGARLVSLDEGFSGDAEVLAGFTLPVTGEYTLLVRSFAGDGGRYSLSLDAGAEGTANFYDAGDLAYEQTRQETLQSNEAHAWFFNGRAGDAVQIEVRPLNNELDLELWLLDPDVERLDTQDSAGRGQPERIEHTLPRDGQYLILVNDFFGVPGEYEIALTADLAQTPTAAGSLTYGQPVNGALTSGQSVLWQFEARRGDQINVTLSSTGAQGDLLFYLQTPEGVRLQKVDSADVGEEETASFSISADGTWGILVEEFFGDPASYQLIVERRRNP